MSGRTERAAAEEFHERQESVVTCVTHAPILSIVRAKTMGRSTSFAGGAVDLSGAHGLRLRILQESRVFLVDRRWSARLVGYSYHINIAATGAEILAWHWHPPAPPHPHLHLKSLKEPVFLARRTHIPGGHISLAAVIRFLIEELDVTPLRNNWRTVLVDYDHWFARDQLPFLVVS